MKIKFQSYVTNIWAAVNVCEHLRTDRDSFGAESGICVHIILSVIIFRLRGEGEKIKGRGKQERASENSGQMCVCVWNCHFLFTRVKMCCCYQFSAEPHFPTTAELHKHSASPQESFFLVITLQSGGPLCFFLLLSESLTFLFPLLLNGLTLIEPSCTIRVWP